jgi:threonine dehydrogenase-like Zn-dependent dehydrogenase
VLDGRVQPGATVAIVGSGPIGLVALLSIGSRVVIVST